MSSDFVASTESRIVIDSLKARVTALEGAVAWRRALKVTCSVCFAIWAFVGATHIVMGQRAGSNAIEALMQ